MLTNKLNLVPTSIGHQNPISGSKVTAILLKGCILPIGGASAGEGLRLQPAQLACKSKKNGFGLAHLRT